VASQGLKLTTPALETLENIGKQKGPHAYFEIKLECWIHCSYQLSHIRPKIPKYEGIHVNSSSVDE